MRAECRRKDVTSVEPSTKQAVARAPDPRRIWACGSGAGRTAGRPSECMRASDGAPVSRRRRARGARRSSWMVTDVHVCITCAQEALDESPSAFLLSNRRYNISTARASEGPLRSTLARARCFPKANRGAVDFVYGDSDYKGAVTNVFVYFRPFAPGTHVFKIASQLVFQKMIYKICGFLRKLWA
ncbi:KLTH0G05764p [Lachancea thermotolerans CBS 6340]|uniref:KLTH0G05764p n=1 Tax=Lachancea thermotolerans (strain ATCC 56472 / CBS 6340 / NRRL Y-8284) TaxID=559295 RepID=C5DM40_LACTC|nr:KLTH0G05764p [Lachancea thermotolerans CBS 6340]CAR24851.1 KLTH0G05764p [Lachancea thermotolerans CBS 6340]